jgi:hypothetical protein
MAPEARKPMVYGHCLGMVMVMGMGMDGDDNSDGDFSGKG